MQGEKERQLVLLCVTGIVIVIIVTVLAIIGIWNRKSEQDKKLAEYKLGRIIMEESVSEENYVKGYFAQIQKMLFEEDYATFYEYLGEDYIEYSGLTEESLKEYLESKKIVGQFLTLKAYESVAVEGFGNAYVLNIKLKDDVYDLTLVVREVSPNDYTIALDEYIKSEKIGYNSTINGINLEIKNVIYFSNYVEYDLVVKNTHDDTVVLNSNNKAEGIYVKLTDDTLVSPYNTVLGGSEAKIEKDRMKEYKIRYNVKNENVTSIESIVIKDIYYNGREVTGDVEFIIN